MDSSLTLRNELSMETHVLTSDFAGSGTWGGNQQGKGSQENCSAMWLAVMGFMEMRLVSGLSLTDHSDSRSFLVA